MEQEKLPKFNELFIEYTNGKLENDIYNINRRPENRRYSFINESGEIETIMYKELEGILEYRNSSEWFNTTDSYSDRFKRKITKYHNRLIKL